MVPEDKYLFIVFVVAVKSCCGLKDEAFSASKKLTLVYLLIDLKLEKKKVKLRKKTHCVSRYYVLVILNKTKNRKIKNKRNK